MSKSIGFAPWRIGGWFGSLPGNRYSRRVALLKVALPALGGTLLLMVMVWPRLAPLFDRFRFTAIDLREARELRMVNPRYAGTDRAGRPFVVTAALGRQVPGRDDVMSLEQARADMQTHNGAGIVMTSDTGVYQTRAQLLDMFGNVTAVHEDGTRIVTQSARLDVANNAGEGHEYVEGHGPRGDISADGFRLIDKGEVIIFTGHSEVLLKPAAQPAGDKAAPPAVPASIAEAAAQIEEKARPALAAAAARKPAPAAAAKPHPAAHHATAKPTPAPHKPAAAPQKPAPKKPG